MSSDDEMPWSAPWTERRGAHDEAAFVADVSAALHVPHAAPEIRMIAEVMAVLDIPSEPERGRTVAQLLEEERRNAGAVVPIRRGVLGRRMAGVAAAAAIALGLLTASAYAGVLPDSIQKVAHSVIDAPAPKHDSAQPQQNGPTQRNGQPVGGSTSAPGSGTTASVPRSSAGATDPAASDAPTSPQPHPSGTPAGGAGSQQPTGPGSNRGNGGKDHKSQAPGVVQDAAVPSPIVAPPTPKTHG